MCGRFTLSRPGEVIDEVFEALESGTDGASRGPAERARAIAALGLEPRFNVAPTQPAPVVRREAERLHLEMLRWGFPAASARQRAESVPGAGGGAAAAGNRPRRAERAARRLLINARSETVAERLSFREAFRHNRCLVLADGFYEWRSSGSRQPFYFRPSGRRSLCFAGLREAPEGSPGSCCLVTTQANALVAEIHDRMPVILEPSSYGLWIDEEVDDLARLHQLLRPAPPGLLEAHPVSTAVNRVAVDAPSLVEPVAEAPPPPENLSLF